MLNRAAPFRHRGFTLTEILVAIGVLLAIVLVTGRVFKVATDVSAIGQATNSVMQEAAAIENRIREDISAMSREGFLTIHCVGVPNDINVQAWQDGGQAGSRPPLLNPTLEPDAVLRCDQLVFFKESVESSQGWNDTTTVSAFPNAQSMHSMVIYGHGVQLPELGEYIPGEPWPAQTPGWGHDPLVTNPRLELPPWRYDNPALDEDQWLETVETDYASSVSSGNFLQQRTPQQNSQYVNATQPEARQWVLARQQVLLGDDDDNYPGDQTKHQYMNNVPSTMSIFPTDVRLSSSNGIGYANTDPSVLAYGRIDVAACPIDEVRQMLQTSRSADDALGNVRRRCTHYYDEISPQEADVNEDGVLDLEPREVMELPSLFGLPGNTYLDQRYFMKDVLHWPRSERMPPGGEKTDHALSSHTLGTACSSIIVEWTWSEGTGEADVPSPYPAKNTDRWHGVHYEAGDPLLANPQNGDPAWVGTDPWLGQRWFGLRDLDRGVVPFYEFQANFPPGANDLFENEYEVTMAPFAVNSYAIDLESGGMGGATPYDEYWATFGLNQEQPDLPILQDVDLDGDGEVDTTIRTPDPSFAPWPTALRITLTLHDPDARLEQGQVYQFIVSLPSQSQGDLAGGD